MLWWLGSGYVRPPCEHVFVHGPAVRDAALRLAAAGINDCEIARQLGVPRTTVRDWRRPSYVKKGPAAHCPRCWLPSRPIALDAGDYAELLGLYLGDGCINPTARSQRLRISLDAAYAGIIENTAALLARGFPANQVGRTVFDNGATVVVHVYSSHLTCLFPQHGPGKKHHRRIVLEGWQQELVESAPWRFLRGCIWSDGCSFINRTGAYEYLSFDFANRSEDILALVEWAYGLVGVQYRRAGGRIRVNQRKSVALVEAHVGRKS
jgi:Homeodomain-like domain